MVAGDEIIISTHRGNKNATYYSQESGIKENINNLIAFGSKFLQIHCGQNTFRYDADENVDNLEDTNKIKKILEINKVDVNNLEINIIDNKINIKNEISVKSIFGSVVGILDYKIKINITGYKSNDKIIIE